MWRWPGYLPGAWLFFLNHEIPNNPTPSFNIRSLCNYANVHILLKIAMDDEIITCCLSASCLFSDINLRRVFRGYF